MTRRTGSVGKIEHRMRLACYLALAALALIAWSLVDPAPLPVIGAMTLGQVIGTASLAFYLFAIIADLGPGLRRLEAKALETAVDQPDRAPPSSKGGLSE